MAEPYSRLAEVYDEIVVDPCHEALGRLPPRPVARRPGRCAHGVGSVLRNRPDVRCPREARLSGNRRRQLAADAGPGPPARWARTRFCSSKPFLTWWSAAYSTRPCPPSTASTTSPRKTSAATLKAVGRCLRPGGWLAFDLHTDAMLAFAASHPVVSGQANGKSFTISNTVDLQARSCVTQIDINGPGDRDTFSERHRQFFFPAADVRRALANADFGSPAVTDEYTDQPATPSILRATWISRRLTACHERRQRAPCLPGLAARTTRAERRSFGATVGFGS